MTAKINNRGQKITEISTRASNWDTSFIDTYTSNNENYDPFERALEQSQTEKHKEFLTIIRTILPVLLGEDNYTVYYLSQVKRIPYAPIAKLMGITEPTARKKCERARKKIIELAEKYEKLENMESELDMLAWSIMNEPAEEEHEFDFEAMEQEYFNNIKNMESELGLKESK